MVSFIKSHYLNLLFSYLSNAAKNKFDSVAFETGVTLNPPASGADIFYAKNVVEVLPGNRIAMLTDGKIVVMDTGRKTSQSFTVPEKPDTVMSSQQRLQRDVALLSLK